jgi:hypothetical protein
MSSLINMQTSAAEAQEYAQPTAADAPKYPWGLCVTLSDDTLDKLGVAALPATDTEVTIIAKAVVSSTRENQTQGGETERSVDLQITDMRVGGLDADFMAKTAQMMYGGDQD